MNAKKLIALLLALVLSLTLFAGCGSSSADTEDETTTEEAEETEEESEESDTASADTSSALVSEEGITITSFQSTNPNMTTVMENDYSDLYWWQQLTEMTGVSFDWYMASYANSEEQFNLLVAADDLPSLVCTGSYYSGGIASAVENEVYVDLEPYLEEYAPDYLEIISDDSIYPIVSDDNGSIVCFYEIGIEEFTPNNGVFLRGDLLEEQGLDVPVTYDEYEETLLALQSAYDLEATIFHYTDNSQWISAGQGVKDGFSIDADGNCVYGPATDAWREYLKIANRWYEEGLIYQDFYAIPDGQNINYMVEYMSTGKSVLCFGYCEFAGMIELGDGEYFVAGYVPRNNEDDEVHLTAGIDPLVQTGNAYAIGNNATEEEIEVICRMMNWLYTDEGALFANYGVEGVTFEYQDDGTPWFTDLITDNEDGLTLTQALITYTGYMVPSHSDYSKYNIASLTTWADFVEVWGTADNAWEMPQVSLTVDEQEAYNAVSTDVETYLDETLTKFIIGDLDINDDAAWEDYLSDLESLGVNTMIESYSAALERYYDKLA